MTTESNQNSKNGKNHDLRTCAEIHLDEVSRSNLQRSSEHRLQTFVLATSRGVWDGVRWKSGSPGIASKPFVDRHGIKSCYVRLRGWKTAKSFPLSVYDKYFKVGSVEDHDYLKSWKKQQGKPKNG